MAENQDPPRARLAEMNLTRAVLAGDETAWHAFVTTHSGILITILRRYLFDQDDVRSVYVDILVALRQGKLAEYAGRSSLADVAGLHRAGRRRRPPAPQPRSAGGARRSGRSRRTPARGVPALLPRGPSLRGRPVAVASEGPARRRQDPGGDPGGHRVAPERPDPAATRVGSPRRVGRRRFGAPPRISGSGDRGPRPRRPRPRTRP